jgi:2-amino-4-hydroxy-6-hydroxymethyldihydropteridine diphosphokinase
MVKVLVGIGSNIERWKNIRFAAAGLSRLFTALRFSSVYEAESVGFKGEPFLNLVASFHTGVELAELQQRLKELESATGRTGQESKCSGRTLDIDILTYGDWLGEFDGIVLPRPEILENAYVLQPLAELEPQTVHGLAGLTYAGLWEAFSGPRLLKKLESAESFLTAR